MVMKFVVSQELKGNIRVFCRVRPLLPDDSVGTEAPVISYPTSVENLDRGIDLTQSGIDNCFSVTNFRSVNNWIGGCVCCKSLAFAKLTLFSVSRAEISFHI